MTENMINVDCAGAGPLSSAVLKAVHNYIDLEEQVGGYEAYSRSDTLFETFRDSIATLLNVESHNIAFFESATDGFDAVLRALPLTPSSIVAFTELDYSTNIQTILRLQRLVGFKTVILPVTAGGVVIPEPLHHVDLSMLVAASLPVATAFSGRAADIDAVLDVLPPTCTTIGDLAQTVGRVPVDGYARVFDVVVATGRKWLCGPRGSGFCAINDATLARMSVSTDTENTSLDRAGQLESHERSFAALAGLGAAVTSLLVDEHSVYSAIAKNSEKLHGWLSEAYCFGLGPMTQADGGILTVTHRDFDAAYLQQVFREFDIRTSILNRSSAPMFYARFSVEDSLRLSPHSFYTDAQWSQIHDAIVTIQQRR